MIVCKSVQAFASSQKVYEDCQYFVHTSVPEHKATTITIDGAFRNGGG